MLKSGSIPPKTHSRIKFFWRGDIFTLMYYIKLRTYINHRFTSLVNVLKVLTTGNGPLGSPINGEKEMNQLCVTHDFKVLCLRGGAFISNLGERICQTGNDQKITRQGLASHLKPRSFKRMVEEMLECNSLSDPRPLCLD